MSLATGKHKTRATTSHITRVLTWTLKNKAWIEGSTNPVIDAITRRYNEDNADLPVSVKTVAKVLKESGVKFKASNRGYGFVTGRAISTNLLIQVNTLGEMVADLYKTTRTPIPQSLYDTFTNAAIESEHLLSARKDED